VFQQKRTDIDKSAEDLANHLRTSDLQRFANDPNAEVFSTEALDKMAQIFSSRFDKKWGGIEKAPKFVMPTIWQFLLRHYHLTKNPESLYMVTHTLKQMAYGGLYDQVGGGFSRYSVDGEWFAPHFEKMLYDNAQLLSLYSEAYAVTHHELFKIVIYETTEWLQREMMHPEGGFYSALDADSEGVEGKFYTWTFSDLKEAAGKYGGIVAEYYHATENGNWEHGRNILKVTEEDERFMKEHGMNKHDLDILIASAKKQLLKVRGQRIRPGLDDKILTGWNAMTVIGLVDAYKALGDILFLNLALKNISFLEKNLLSNDITPLLPGEGQGVPSVASAKEGVRLARAFKNKASDTEGFLEDYAFLIQAYAALYQVTFDESWLTKAEKWCSYVIAHFYDEADGFFHFSSRHAEQLIAQKKEIFDNVIPASNSVMARALFHVGTLLDKEDWKKMAVQMSSKLASLTESEPGYMSHWGILFAEITKGLAEVVIVGKDAEKIRKELHTHHLPFALTLGATTSSDLPLFEGREAKDNKTMIYVCFNKTCKLPVTVVDEAISVISTSS